MPKDPTKNIDRYKIAGGELNPAEFQENQQALAEQHSSEEAQLIPGTPPEVRVPEALREANKAITEERTGPAKRATKKRSTKKVAAKKSGKRRTAGKSASKKQSASKKTSKASKKRTTTKKSPSAKKRPAKKGRAAKSRKAARKR